MCFTHSSLVEGEACVLSGFKFKMIYSAECVCFVARRILCPLYFKDAPNTKLKFSHLIFEQSRLSWNYKNHIQLRSKRRPEIIMPCLIFMYLLNIHVHMYVVFLSRIIRATLFYAHLIVGFGPVYYTYNVCLVILQLLHLLWTYYISRIALEAFHSEAKEVRVTLKWKQIIMHVIHDDTTCENPNRSVAWAV